MWKPGQRELVVGETRYDDRMRRKMIHLCGQIEFPLVRRAEDRVAGAKRIH